MNYVVEVTCLYNHTGYIQILVLYGRIRTGKVAVSLPGIALFLGLLRVFLGSNQFLGAQYFTS